MAACGHDLDLPRGGGDLLHTSPVEPSPWALGRAAPGWLDAASPGESSLGAAAIFPNQGNKETHGR